MADQITLQNLIDRIKRDLFSPYKHSEASASKAPVFFIEEAELGQFADEILNLIKPAIAVRTRRTSETGIPVGVSKFGGSPDLPEDSSWPM